MVLRGDTLAYLYGSLGPFSAADRAAAVSQRLANLRRQGVDSAEVRVVTDGPRPEVWVGQLALLTVTAQDTLAHGSSAAATSALAAMARTGLRRSLLTRNIRDLLKGLLETIVALALEPTRVALAAVVGYLPSLFYIAVIVVLTYYGLRIVRMVFSAVAQSTIRIPGFYADWAIPTYNLLRVLVAAFAVILIWPYLPNSGSDAFKGVAAFLGLLLTFGSAGAVSNVVGGVVLIYMRPFQIGDRVRISDTMGDVVERGMLVTRIRTPKKVEITIPNSMVLGSHIVNYSTTAREGGVILHTTVTIGYDAPWTKVHEVMKEAARRTDGVLDTPAPFVLQTALGDYAVSYEINAYTAVPEQMTGIYSALHQNLQDTFAEAGIEIMSPAYHALRDGNPSTIPSPHGPAGDGARATVRMPGVEG